VEKEKGQTSLEPSTGGAQAAAVEMWKEVAGLLAGDGGRVAN